MIVLVASKYFGGCKAYEPVLNTVGKTFAGIPFVQTTKNEANEYIFKLKYKVL